MFGDKFGKIQFGRKGTFTFNQRGGCRGLGRHNEMPDSEFDASELAAGIKEEMEHTNNLDYAKRIAKDHLMEDKKYYTKLFKAGL